MWIVEQDQEIWNQKNSVRESVQKGFLTSRSTMSENSSLFSQLGFFKSCKYILAIIFIIDQGLDYKENHILILFYAITWVLFQPRQSHSINHRLCLME